MVTTTDTAMKPIGQMRGLPLYANGEAPKHLRSKSQLRDGLRLRLAPGQQPVCFVRVAYHPDEPCPLYDPAAAVPPKDQSAGAVWTYRQRRTCPKCGVVREHIVHGSQCGVCWREDQARIAALQERTCGLCGRRGDKPYPRVWEGWYWFRERLCRACRAERRRKLAALLAELALCAGGCGKRVASKKQILDWAIANQSAVPRWPRRYCPPCQAVHDAEVEARNAERRACWDKQRAEEHAREEAQRAARRAELAELRQWAADMLADPAVVILDTETTGLHASARIVDIAVITATGETLIDTLVNPGEPIPAEATDIHGITDEMVADAPTFADIIGDLSLVLIDRRILIYNAAYDTRILNYELGLLQAADAESTVAIPALLLGPVKGEDAMVPYSDWYGEWNEYRGGYRWQRLGGGHRARGDCLAVIGCLKAMARPSVYETEDDGV